MSVAAGCAVRDADLDRWEQTVEGPKRLSAVVLHEKYPHDLRVSAAMSLIDMKPRKGQRVGIERLVKGTLVCDPSWMERKKAEPCQTANFGAEARAALLKSLVPRMIAELQKPPPVPVQGGQLPADPSFQYKDAAYMMLTYEKTQLVTEPQLRQELLDALKEWAMADFERRLSDQTQMYGMEQVLRLIGPTSVERLPALISKDSLRDLSKMADLVDRLGEQKTKEEAGKQLVKVVEFIGSAAWRKEKEPEVKAANDKGGFKPDEKQFAQQVEDYQVEVMMRVYGAMKKVGGAAVVEHSLRVAADKGSKAKIRQIALAALDGHIDKKNVKDIDRLVEIAKSSDTPLEVVDIAFRHLKQMPRPVVAKKLYQLFDSEDWKLRRLAGSTILQMSQLDHIDEFMKELTERATKNFNLPEARTYAAYLGDLKAADPQKPGASALERLKPYMKDGKPHARIVALAYYLVFGTKKDVATVKAFAEDKGKAPKCDEKAECSWECIVVGADKKEEKKTIGTVSEFIEHCVVPKLERTDEAPKTEAPAKGTPAPQPDAVAPPAGSASAGKPN